MEEEPLLCLTHERKPKMWNWLSEKCSSPNIVSISLTAAIVLVYRIFLGEFAIRYLKLTYNYPFLVSDPIQPPPPSPESYFRQPWIWMIIGMMGLTIVAATTRSILKNTITKQGRWSQDKKEGSGPDGKVRIVKSEKGDERIMQDHTSKAEVSSHPQTTSASTYLRIAIASGAVALLLFSAGIYALLRGITAKKQQRRLDFLPRIAPVVTTVLSVPFLLYLNPLKAKKSG